MLPNLRYLLVGSGRTSTHFKYYSQILGVPFHTWDRSQNLESLFEKLSSSTHVLLLISDSAIASFARTHLAEFSGLILHFSGAQYIPGLHAVHPLMSFSHQLYTEDLYRRIPFISSSEKPADELLPGFPNAFFRISAEQQAYYHALCVMSGNFTTLLWQKMAAGLQGLGLPTGVESSYRQQIFQNLDGNLKSALTGPLARKDLATVLQNDEALENDDFRPIYRAFVDLQFPEATPQLKGLR